MLMLQNSFSTNMTHSIDKPIAKPLAEEILKPVLSTQNQRLIQLQTAFNSVASQRKVPPLNLESKLSPQGYSRRNVLELDAKRKSSMIDDVIMESEQGMQQQSAIPLPSARQSIPSVDVHHKRHR